MTRRWLTASHRYDVPCSPRGAAAWIPERVCTQRLTLPRRWSWSASTEKELEVLGHLAELLTTEEIAETMFVSVNTVRTHVRNILRKLGVPRRNAAVRRARELDLLPG